MLVEVSFYIVIHLNKGQHFADYHGNALPYSGHLKNKLRVAEVNNAGGRNLKTSNPCALELTQLLDCEMLPITTAAHN